jgi:putative restriction endonuclease
MNADELRQRVADIAVWQRGSERAPHKPLLLLMALARYSRGEPSQIPYAVIDWELRELLAEFGPSRKSYHPEYPFWRLQNDGIWELQNAENVAPRKSSTNAKRSEPLKYGVT